MGSESLTLNNLDETYLKRLASNPYIALDLWLRADAGYDQWQNVRVVDGQHRRVHCHGWARTPHPSRFAWLVAPC